MPTCAARAAPVGKLAVATVPPLRAEDLTPRDASHVLRFMKTATVRDLRFRFSEIEARLRQGEEVVIRKRKRIIAKLVPFRAEEPMKPYLPDFAARRRKIFGEQVMAIPAAELVAWDRSRG